MATPNLVIILHMLSVIAMELSPYLNVVIDVLFIVKGIPCSVFQRHVDAHAIYWKWFLGFIQNICDIIITYQQ
jgi:hypothetical protein